MTILRLTYMAALAILGSSAAAPYSDPNSRLFAHMAPVFQMEQEKLISDKRQPILEGSSLVVLEEASARVLKLVESGAISRDKGEKLIHSLEAAQKVRKLASLLDGTKVRGH